VIYKFRPLWVLPEREFQRPRLGGRRHMFCWVELMVAIIAKKIATGVPEVN